MGAREFDAKKERDLAEHIEREARAHLCFHRAHGSDAAVLAADRKADFPALAAWAEAAGCEAAPLRDDLVRLFLPAPARRSPENEGCPPPYRGPRASRGG